MHDKSLIRNNFISKKAEETLSPVLDEKRVGLVCPNCGAELIPQKCKLRCERRGCGYLVTCSEW